MQARETKGEILILVKSDQRWGRCGSVIVHRTVESPFQLLRVNVLLWFGYSCVNLTVFVRSSFVESIVRYSKGPAPHAMVRVFVYFDFIAITSSRISAF